MRFWNVTYKGKDGQQTTVTIEAPSRSELFAELDKRGITAIRVDESNGRNRRRKKNGGSSISATAIMACCAAIVLIGLVLWFVIAKTDDADAEADQVRSGKIAASAPIKRSTAPHKVEYESPEKTGDKLKDALAEVAAAENALTIRQAPKINIPPGYTNRTFKTGVEQLMSWVFTVEVGDMPMPIPPIGDDDREQLAAILVSKNEINESDSEMTAFAKEQVDYAKHEMAEFIKQGGDPDEFLQYYFGQLRHAFEFRNEAQQQYYDMLEEDPELAEEFARQVNKSFDEKGIKHIQTEKDEQEAEEQEQ